MVACVVLQFAFVSMATRNTETDEVASHDGSAVCCVGMWNLGHRAVGDKLQKLLLMMEVQSVVLECGILVIGWLRIFCLMFV